MNSQISFSNLMAVMRKLVKDDLQEQVARRKINFYAISGIQSTCYHCIFYLHPEMQNA